MGCAEDVSCVDAGAVVEIEMKPARNATDIERTSEEVLGVEHGSLCPAIHRLKKRGLITASPF